MDILIIIHFFQLSNEVGNERFHYIANLINKDNRDIEIVTSNFCHTSKKDRKLGNEFIEENYKITFLKEPVYRKNVSLKRIYSHYIIGRNLEKYLKKRKKPDIIYCAVPSLDLAKKAAEYANKNKITFIIDVRDLWPEAFEMVVSILIVKKILFSPLRRKANYIYKSADEIVGVSKTYINRAMAVNNKVEEGHCVYLGTDLDTFDSNVEINDTDIKNTDNNTEKIDKNIEKNYINLKRIGSNDNKEETRLKKNNEIWIAYIGTLGASYDLTTVIDALKILKNNGIENLKFIVMGDGPLRDKFQSYAKKEGINCEFTGMLLYPKMVNLLARCDIAVNPIAKGAAQSVINKVCDYAAAGLPVLNTAECVEYRDLLEEYGAGINCSNNDRIDLAGRLLYLYNNEEERKRMGKNNRKLGEEKFDRRKTYLEIADLIQKYS